MEVLNLLSQLHSVKIKFHFLLFGYFQKHFHVKCSDHPRNITFEANSQNFINIISLDTNLLENLDITIIN